MGDNLKNLINKEQKNGLVGLQYPDRKMKPYRKAKPEEKREVREYIEHFYNLLHEVWGDDERVFLRYSIHALIDELEKALNSLTSKELAREGEQTRVKQEKLKELLLVLMSDKGYLFYETRDAIRGKNTKSFKDLYSYREYNLKDALLDKDLDQMADDIFGFLHGTKTGREGWTEIGHGVMGDGLAVDRKDHGFGEMLEEKYSIGAKKAGLSPEVFKRRVHKLVRHTLDSKKEVSKETFIQELQNGYPGCPTDLFQKEISEAELKSLYEEEKKGEEGEINSIEDLLTELHHCYKNALKVRKQSIEDLKRLEEEILTSEEQWTMYERRESVPKWLPVVRRSLASLLEELGDASFNYKDTLEVNDLNCNGDLRSTSSGQHELDFVELVGRHYTKRRRIMKGENYRMTEEVKQRILGWLKCSQMEEMPASPPIAAYLFLSVPSRLVQVSLKEAAQTKNISNLKTAKERREEIRFFCDLVGYYKKILEPGEQKISEWMNDFNAITGYLDFVQETFEESMQQRYAEPQIRGPVLNPGIDYEGVFQEFDKMNPEIRGCAEKELRENPSWIEYYRKLWETMAEGYKIKSDCLKIFIYRKHRKIYIRNEDYVWWKVFNICPVETYYDNDKTKMVPEWHKLKSEHFLCCMVEDVLRKENIKLSCRKVRAMMQRCFPMEASGCENIAEQSQPSQGGIPIKEEPSTTP